MTIAAIMSKTEVVLDEIRYYFPVTCSLLALWLVTTSVLPLSALGKDVAAILSRGQDIAAALPGAATRLVSELANCGRHHLARLMSGCMSRYVVRRKARLIEDMNSPDEISSYLKATLVVYETEVYTSVGKITSRTLVIGGTQDQFFGQNIASTANAIRHSRLHLLPDETHMALIERGTEFQRQISGFLSEVKSHTKTKTGRESVSTGEGDANADV